MAEQPDSGFPSRGELQQLIAKSAADATNSPALDQVLWRLPDSRHRTPCLTARLPGTDAGGGDDVFRGRLVWWPDGLTDRRRVAMLSSRIGARHDQFRWWYDLLRTAILRISVDEECVVTVDGTATHAATLRAAKIFGIPRLTITVHDGDGDLEQLVGWLAARIDEVRRNPSEPDPLAWRAHVSPRCLPQVAAVPARQARRIPLRDQCAVAAGERSYVLSCRRGGNIHQLLCSRLRVTADKAPICFVASGPGTEAAVFRELIGLGAVPWLVSGVEADSGVASSAQRSSSVAAVLQNGPLERPHEWLCHWTRPCPGPWPGQPATDYLDELLLGCETADRSALATLLQIISQRIVLASVIRESHRAVSFTAVALAEFRQRRVYRRHRRRYDFEPWGIAVRRDALLEKGIRPVQYGFRNKPAAVQHSAWFQPATDQSGAIDWRQEQEWRLTQDLRLDELPEAAVCVFVDTVAEAAVVAARCNWPVIAVPD